jgi:hypothetical protein
MNFRRFAVATFLLTASLPRLLAQAPFPPDVSRVLQEAVKQRQQYVQSFKDLTGTETRTTEIFNKDGKVEDRRVVVSDFLVYESRLKAGVVNEYRITREVDGKVATKGERQATELFEKLAKARTLEQEGNRLRDENLKHTLRYYRWGVTLQLAPQLQGSTNYEYEVAGREQIQGRDVIILKYKRKNLITGEFKGLIRNFKDPKTGNRGRLWLDAETYQVWRWENESTVIDRELPTESVLSRDEIEYESSAFGVNVPVRIVTSYFDKKGASNGALRLAGRITFAYGKFKRFGVSAEYKVEQP